jgi:hypothetical protein
VRALWRPPKMVTNIGKTEVIAGDIAKPVINMKGNSTNMTAR